MSGTTDFVTISAREAQELRALATLYDKVWNDPDVGETVRKASKKHHPTLNIPDDNPVVLRAKAEVGALAEKVTGLETMLTEFQTKAQQREAEAGLRKTLGDVQGKYKLTDEGMAGVIKVMQERQLADPEAAALVYRESIPKAPPISASARIFDTKADMYGTTRQDERWETLHNDPDKFFSDVVNEVFAEMPA